MLRELGGNILMLICCSFALLGSVPCIRATTFCCFRDEKSKAMLNVAINDERSDGNVGKIGNCFHWK
jgi:hypothetical protein